MPRVLVASLIRCVSNVASWSDPLGVAPPRRRRGYICRAPSEARLVELVIGGPAAVVWLRFQDSGRPGRTVVWRASARADPRVGLAYERCVARGAASFAAIWVRSGAVR